MAVSILRFPCSTLEVKDTRHRSASQGGTQVWNKQVTVTIGGLRAKSDDNQVPSCLPKLQTDLHSFTGSWSTHSFSPVLGKTTNRGLFCTQRGSSHFTRRQPVSEHRSACSTWSLRGQEGTVTDNDRKEKWCWSKPTQRLHASRFQGQSRKSNNLLWQGQGTEC